MFRALPRGRRAVVSGLQRGCLPGKRASSVRKQNSPGEKDPSHEQQSLVLPCSVSTGSPGGGTAAASLRGADGLRGVSVTLGAAQHQSEEEPGSRTTCLSLLLLLPPLPLPLPLPGLRRVCGWLGPSAALGAGGDGGLSGNAEPGAT